MNKYNLSKKMNTFVLITAVLLLAGIVVTIIFANRAPLVKTITLIIGYLLALYYAFWGYKTPHGNLLRYLIYNFYQLNILIQKDFYIIKNDSIRSNIFF